jgi:hypothetical protein
LMRCGGGIHASVRPGDEPAFCRAVQSVTR